MPRAAFGMQGVVVLVASAVIAGVTAGIVARRRGDGNRPLSTCEQDCIKNHPDDTQARLNCMLKCIADGKISFGDVLAPR